MQLSKVNYKLLNGAVQASYDDKTKLWIYKSNPTYVFKKPEIRELKDMPRFKLITKLENAVIQMDFTLKQMFK